MPEILILNGPNLNLTGTREPEIYGSVSFEEWLRKLESRYPDVRFVFLQSNVEGELINYLHQYGFLVDGIVFNPGGYSHTSIAISDAIRAIRSTVVEVHLSNVYSREEYRRQMITASACEGHISGLGFRGYELAVDYLLSSLSSC